MGFFSKIFTKIFPSANASEVVAAQPPQAPSEAGVAAAPVAPASIALGDVAPILDAMPGAKGLNWRTSIVDLMKLTGMDSTLAERKELANELGYTGDTSDTATMNSWLHKQVIARIRADGGQIRDLTD